MAEYTSGPWRVETRNTVLAICCTPTRRGEWSDICYQERDGHPEHGSITGRMRTSAELAANARLIAAAPDLLEALQTLCDLTANVICRDGDRFQVGRDKAQAAIAKATGSES